MNRVHRGFHRLGLFLAIPIVLIGGGYWLNEGLGIAAWSVHHHAALMCGLDFLQKDEKRFWELSLYRKNPLDIDTTVIDLKALDCSQAANGDMAEIVSFAEVRAAPSYSWISTLGSELLSNVVFFIVYLTLILALATYAVVRAIGWVVGGFSRDEW
jgi:hypothetical protein